MKKSNFLTPKFSESVLTISPLISTYIGSCEFSSKSFNIGHAVFHKTTVSFLTKQRDRLSFMSRRTFAKCLNKVINFNVLINKFGIGQGTSKANSDGNSGSLFYKLDFSSCAMAFRNPVLFIN